MIKSKRRSVVGYILFQGIKIESASALSGNLIYGTPSLAGIKGAFHAMSRKLMVDKQTAALDIRLRGVMIACHEHRMYASRADSFRDYHFTQQKPSPSTAGDLAKMSVGTLPSIIQQAQCYMNMSFVVEVVSDCALAAYQQNILVQRAAQLIQHQRIAGGNVRPFSNSDKVTYIELSELDSLPYKIPKCHVLTDASDVMLDLTKRYPDLSPTDVLIDVCSNHHFPSKADNSGISWSSTRISTHYGWVVPLMVGYHGITQKFEAGLLENSRTNESDSQYVESVYSLGKWTDAHKLQLEGNLKTAFWYYDYQPDKSLYLIATNQTK